METQLPVSESQTLTLVVIPPGEFVMGSTRGFPLETPVHPVRIARPFRLGKFPVTQGQWGAVMGSRPEAFPGEDRRPVETVSWEDAQAFCARLSEVSGSCVRLPSEAEWEYACRAGTTTEFFFGDNEGGLAEYAWFDLNSSEQTHPVGLKKPNGWDLHDMVGNVWEWCEDVWHDDYDAAPADGSPWRQDAAGQPRRCLRGGAWSYDAFRCRCAYRSREWKQAATDHIGLRVVVESGP